MSSHHQHGRPDGLGDALPQLGGGARLVEPPGELPRLGWSRRSHGTEHLSSEFQRTRPRRCDSEESRAPGNVRRDAGRRLLGSTAAGEEHPEPASPRPVRGAP
ncbi:unnamed protein product [Pleuronectes platessa]|uniref:Uncharacterized protein n=1 Tax=Pleuronectes platessa TaxID=8262 RepID=A0A9N7Z5K8_PLEPL|nr:unnamed protein product [Pleuronectes platessa]